MYPQIIMYFYHSLYFLNIGHLFFINCIYWFNLVNIKQKTTSSVKNLPNNEWTDPPSINEQPTRHCPIDDDYDDDDDDDDDDNDNDDKDKWLSQAVVG